MFPVELLVLWSPFGGGGGAFFADLFSPVSFPPLWKTLWKTPGCLLFTSAARYAKMQMTGFFRT